MTVKDVICQALCLLGREEIADAVTANADSGTQMNAEAKRYAKLFILIADSVTKELYSGYFPDTMTCVLNVTGGGFDLSTLKYPVIRIREVTNAINNEKITDYTLTNGIIGGVGETDSIRVTYEYTSYDYTALGDNIADCKRFITPDILVTGMIAEYYCTIGDTVNAALWQERYENKIKLILDSGIYKPHSGQEEETLRRVSLPCRRWV